MRKQSSPSSSALPLVHPLLLLTLLFVAKDGGIVRVAKGGKRRVSIPDELEDAIDDEEDDATRKWAQKPSPSQDSEFDPPPDFSKMDPSQILAEMMKQQSSPSFGFVKLRLGVRRSPDMVSEIAMKWTKVLKTESIEVKFIWVWSSRCLGR
ncbi:uncharacterized protein LOC122659278 [Telopea speciosissima]|uniref:uncharacterized protein LOC122659278 n=1 Tax=Telopea speciosissima TaxID=54955 RepID=UPI001CC388D9|nr:uncharacterized protein LOC122659278 [Telopea speciosissima]